MAEEPLFDPESVLATAFGNHDFLAQHKGQEISIQTTDLITDGSAVYIDVTAQTNPLEHGVVYRYRIELEKIIEADATDPGASLPRQ